jgi:hypothetical protein
MAFAGAHEENFSIAALAGRTAKKSRANLLNFLM